MNGSVDCRTSWASLRMDPQQPELRLPTSCFTIGHNSTQLSVTAGEYTTSTVVCEAWMWLSLCWCIYWPQLNPALSDRRGIHYKYCGMWSMSVAVFVLVCLLATTQPSSQRRHSNTLQVLWYVKHECDCLCVGVFTGHNPVLSDCRGINYKYCGTWSMTVTVFVLVYLLATTQPSCQRPPENTLQVLWYVKHECGCLCVGVFTGHSPALSDRRGMHYKYCGMWSMTVTVFVLVYLLTTTQPSSQRPLGNTLQVMWYSQSGQDWCISMLGTYSLLVAYSLLTCPLLVCMLSLYSVQVYYWRKDILV